MTSRPDRNLGMDLVRVTEAAAIAAARYMGLDRKADSDQAAVDAMRAVLETVDMDGIIVIGEGEKDNAPMLYNGERVGTGRSPRMDVAVDPIDGTRLLAKGRPNAISVIALADRDTMWSPGPSLYMNKLVVGREAKDVIDITDSATQNLQRIARALERPVSEVTVFILDKPRHQDLIAELRRVGARIALHTDNDISGALMAAISGTGVDVLMGIGGTPEGVISAAAVKALGGGMQALCAPQSRAEQQRLNESTVSKYHEVLLLEDLVASDDAFFAATGITDGPLLEGIHYDRQARVTTQSIVIRSLSGSMRYVQGIHQMKRDLNISDLEVHDAVKMAIEST